jgi:hypothetical protein
VVEVAGLRVEVMRLEVAHCGGSGFSPSYGKATAWAFCSSMKTRG